MSSYGKRSPFAWDGDRVDGFRLIEIPFSPLLHTRSDDTDDVEELFISPRDYGSRQEYLRSYTFTRAEANVKVPEKVKRSLLRLKAAAWAVVACKYRLPLRARILKEKMIIRSSQYFNNGVQYLRPSCVQMPKCLMAGG